MIRTRFAPSPTGYMHLGNIWIAFLNWLWTKENKGQIILRIEDIDRQRCKPQYIQGIIDDLTWLGLDYDEGPKDRHEYGSTIQSLRNEVYDKSIDTLTHLSLIYPCFCNRARIQKISSAPHIGETPHMYDGKCRHLSQSEIQSFTKEPSWRIKIYDTAVSFEDMFQGKKTRLLRENLNDFVVRRADKMMAYQLAASVDDAEMGITHVLRGHDLLESTFYQIYILKKLSKKCPTYGHLPLLVDKEHVRLSKRQKGITIKEMREDGMSSEEIIGHLLYLAGALPKDEPISAEYARKNISFHDLQSIKKEYIEV